jgi:hypothetical protein
MATRSVGIAAQIKIIGELSLVFLGQRFGFIWLLSENLYHVLSLLSKKNHILWSPICQTLRQTIHRSDLTPPAHGPSKAQS